MPHAGHRRRGCWASLNHPCLVTLFDAQVTAADQAYLVMELIDGPTLRHIIEAGPIDPPDVARVLQDLAGGLAAVHRAGVVHRDVRPSNVLLRSEPGGRPPYRAVLADFGVAHLVDAARLTTPGTVIGTAAYLAPEQVHGGEPTTASDVYALGLLTLEALSRLHPFGTVSAPATLLARLSRDPDMPADLGERWSALLSAIAARDPADRPTADEIEERASKLGPLGDRRGSPRREARDAPSAPTRVMAVDGDEPTVALPFAPAMAARGPVAIDASSVRSSGGAETDLDEMFGGDRAGDDADPPTSRRRAGVIALVAGVVAALLPITWMVLATLSSGKPATPPPDPVVSADTSVPAPASDEATTTEQGSVEQSSSDDSGADGSVPDGSVPDETTPVETVPVGSTPAETVPVDPAAPSSPATDPAAPSSPATDPAAPSENPNKGPGNNNGNGNGNGDKKP